MDKQRRVGVEKVLAKGPLFALDSPLYHYGGYRHNNLNFFVPFSILASVSALKSGRIATKAFSSLQFCQNRSIPAGPIKYLDDTSS